MKRAIVMFMTLSASLLLAGCGPHWDDGERYGRDRGYDHDRRYDRGYDDDRGHDRRYGHRDNGQGYERTHDRDHGDQDD